MNNESKNTKIDFSSTAIERGIDIAKNFIEKLVSPSIEELGLLVRDQISYWRFNNQIKILNKAKIICEENNISVKSIPPKLLCPYLENASLEDDDTLQDKWANLLVNMVDSQQNIQNHVFPYILSQLSKDEFELLETSLIEKNKRTSELEEELSSFIENRSAIESNLKTKITELNSKLKSVTDEPKSFFSKESMEIRSEVRAKERELNSFKYKESTIKRQIAAPQKIPENIIKEFEIANIIRLGLAKVVYTASAGTHSIDIPASDPDTHTSVDFDIEIDTDTTTILTELGELFIEACRKKNA